LPLTPVFYTSFLSGRLVPSKLEERSRKLTAKVDNQGSRLATNHEPLNREPLNL